MPSHANAGVRHSKGQSWAYGVSDCRTLRSAARLAALPCLVRCISSFACARKSVLLPHRPTQLAP